jgi:hypothetical protein
VSGVLVQHFQPGYGGGVASVRAVVFSSFEAELGVATLMLALLSSF